MSADNTDSVKLTERDERGPRALDRGQHYALCNGLDCPCYQEGTEVLAVNHREMVEWFAKRAPHMLVEALVGVGYSVNADNQPSVKLPSP